MKNLKAPNPYKGQIIEYQNQLYYRIDEKHFFKISDGNKVLAGEFAREIDVKDYTTKDNIEVIFEFSPESLILSGIYDGLSSKNRKKLKSKGNYPNYTKLENAVIEYIKESKRECQPYIYFLKKWLEEDATMYITTFDKYIPLQIDGDYFHVYSVKKNRLETHYIL